MPFELRRLGRTISKWAAQIVELDGTSVLASPATATLRNLAVVGALSSKRPVTTLVLPSSSGGAARPLVCQRRPSTCARVT